MPSVMGWSLFPAQYLATSVWGPQHSLLCCVADGLQRGGVWVFSWATVHESRGYSVRTRWLLQIEFQQPLSLLLVRPGVQMACRSFG